MTIPAAPLPRRRLAPTLAGVAALFAVALTLWVVGAPRPRVVSLGDGTGVPSYGSDGASVSATLLLGVLLCGAGAAAALLIWRRHARTHTASAAAACWIAVGLVGVLIAAAAPPVARLVYTAGTDAASGQVVDLAPRLTRQAWATGSLGAVAEHLVFFAWTAAGAIAAWFVATYSQVVSDLR